MAAIRKTKTAARQTRKRHDRVKQAEADRQREHERQLAAKAKEDATKVPETILQEAQRLVHGDRHHDYGHPIDDYTRLGRIWGAMLGREDLDPRLCALMMAAVKLNREVYRPKRDNRVDLAGYAECAQMIDERQQKDRDSLARSVSMVFGGEPEKLEQALKFIFGDGADGK